MGSSTAAPAPSSALAGNGATTIDWCEENYAVLSDVAEFWNTSTAILTILPAAIWLTQPNPPGTQWYRLFHLNLALVQFGSALFHGSLSWLGQLLDEVPILVWCCASICVTIDTFTIVNCDRGTRRVWWAPGPLLLALLGSLQVALTTYLYMFHAKFYHTFLSVVVVQAALHWPLIMYELFSRESAETGRFVPASALAPAGPDRGVVLSSVDKLVARKGVDEDSQDRSMSSSMSASTTRPAVTTRQHRHHVTVLRRLLLLHVATGYGGFGLWTLENTFCEHLRFLQLHAWWHVLGVASMKYWHDFLVYYRLCVLSQGQASCSPVYRPSLFGLGQSVFSSAQVDGQTEISKKPEKEI